MRRFRHFNGSSDQPQIDMSPLIDMVFILLIFFIVTSVFVEETGIDVDKPTAASAQQLQQESIFIALTSEGQIWHAGSQISLDGLRTMLRRKLRDNAEQPVIIRPDKNGRNSLLIAVMDAANQAGAQKVSIASEKVR